MARIKLLGVRFSAGEFVQICRLSGCHRDHAYGLGSPSGAQRPERQARSAGAVHPPPAGDPPAKLTRTAGTRFTEEQFVALGVHARACGLTVTAFIRRVVLGVKPVARIPATSAAIVAVNRVGNNLNQLVKLANSGIVLAPDLMRVVGEVLAEVRALQERLFRAYSGDNPKPTE